MLTTAVIINYRGGELLCDCIASIEAQGRAVEIIVVDNSPEEPSAMRAAAEFPSVKVVTAGRNLGYAEGANFGATHASGTYLLILNPDTRLGQGSLAALESAMEADDGLGVCGPVLTHQVSNDLDEGRTIDYLGTSCPVPPGGLPLYVSGCALMTRASLFERLGGFDERYFMFVEEVDYCWRALLAGLDVRVVAGANMAHVGGAAAPGGYESEGRLLTTPFRVALRERNCLAMLLKCLPASSLAWVLPAYVAQSFVTSAALAFSGQMRAAVLVLRALLENVAWMPSTMAARRRTRRTQAAADRSIRARMYQGSTRLRLARQVGIPRVESPPPERRALYRRNEREGRLRGTHAVLIKLVPPGSRVLDVGCARGYLGPPLTAKGCRVWGIDVDRAAVEEARSVYEDVRVVDLNSAESLPWSDGSFDVVLAGDVLEHLGDPGRILQLLRGHLAPGGAIVASLPNVAHASVRFNLMAGRFDYGDDGILDRSHWRLFTFSSARELFNAGGYRVVRTLSGSDRFGDLLNGSKLFGRLRGLLAHQIIVVAKLREDPRA